MSVQLLENAIAIARERRNAAIDNLAAVQEAFSKTAARFTANDCSKSEEKAHSKNIDRFWAAQREKDQADTELNVLARALEIATRLVAQEAPCIVPPSSPMTGSDPANSPSAEAVAG